MPNNKHKEKDTEKLSTSAQVAESTDIDNDFSVINESKKENGTSKNSKNHAEDDAGKSDKDYWERVADDVASGYSSEDDNDSILNTDQQPDDHERGV